MQIKTSSTRFLVLLIGFVTICSADCGKGRQRSESCGGSSVIRKVRGAYDDAFSISTDRMQKIAMLITGIRIQNQLLSGTLNADSFLEGLLGFESPPVQIANPEKLKALIQALRVLAANLSIGAGDKPNDKLKLKFLEEKLEAIETIRKLIKNAGNVSDSKEYFTEVNKALSSVNETLLSTMEDAIATWQRVTVKINEPNFYASYSKNYLEGIRRSAMILKEHGAKLAEMCNLTIPSATKIISMLEGMGIVKKFSGKADDDDRVITAAISEISSAAKVAKDAKVEFEAVKAMFSGSRRSEGFRDMVLALRDPWVNKIVPLEAMKKSLAPLLWIIEGLTDSQDADPSSPLTISFLSQVQNLINFPEDPEPLLRTISTCSSTMSTMHFEKVYGKFIKSAKSLESQVKEVHETLRPFSTVISSQETLDQLQEVIGLCTISGKSTDLKSVLDTLKGSEAFKDLTGMLNGSGKRIVTFSKMKNFRQSAMEIDSNRLAIIADLDTFHASEFYQCLTSLQHGTLVAIWRQFRGLEGRSIVETGENLFRSSGEDAVDLKTLREEVLEAKGKSTKETEALKSLNKLSPHATVLGLATKGLVAMKYALENRMHAELVMRSGPVIQKYMPIIDQELSQKLEAIVQLNTSLETLYQKLEQWSDGVKETDNESTMLSAYSEVFTSALSIPDVPGDLKDMQLTVLKVQDSVPLNDLDLDSLYSSLMALDRYGLNFSNFKVDFANNNNSKDALEAMHGFFAAYKAQVAGFTGSHGTGPTTKKSKRTRVEYVMWPSWLLVTSGLIAGLAMIVFFSVCLWKGFPRKNRRRLGPLKSISTSGSPSKSNSTSKSGNGTSKSSESSSTTPPKAKSV